MLPLFIASPAINSGQVFGDGGLAYESMVANVLEHKWVILASGGESPRARSRELAAKARVRAPCRAAKPIHSFGLGRSSGAPPRL